MRARATVARSPEQVGAQTGVHGRTIRRLEAGESTRPRRTTLQALAGFYALNGELLTALGAWSAEGVSGDELRARIVDRARAALGAHATAAGSDADAGDELVVHLAMRLSRAGRGQPASEDRSAGREGSALAFATEMLRGPADAQREELTRLLEYVQVLDRPRARMLVALAREMHQAQTADRILAARRDRAGLPPRGGGV